MQRLSLTPRPDWRKKVEDAGLIFHTAEGNRYWDESACYRFSMDQVLEIEAATNTLSELCLKAAEFVIEGDKMDWLRIPKWVQPLIRRSWDAEPPSIYGRFDLAYDGRTPPRLLEFNADTPTSLLEAAAVQWFWLEEVFPGKDQFNSIHERLIAKWRELKPYLDGAVLYFAHIDADEDAITAAYLADTARQAEINTAALLMDDLGWDAARGLYVDMESRPIVSIFKLYPWEWMVHEEFGQHLAETFALTQWVEPIWKMVLSNKGILPVLWALNPDHPNLLPAFFDEPRGMAEFVRKPLLSREGANITLQSSSGVIKTEGEYGEEGFIYQALAPLPTFSGNTPVIGSWLVDWAAAGMGIRESTGPITDNLSRFVPHYIG